MVWAYESSGSNAAFFHFINGTRLWTPQYHANLLRSLPVRSGKYVIWFFDYFLLLGPVRHGGEVPGPVARLGICFFLPYATSPPRQIFSISSDKSALLPFIIDI